MTPSFRLLCAVSLSLGQASPSFAVTGSGSAPSEPVARAIVTVVAAGGGVCTGTLIASTIVLTAAHCIAPGNTNRVIDYSQKPPKLIAPLKTITHPQYNAQAIAEHRATADVALLQLPSPLSGKSPAPLGAPRLPVLIGAPFTVVGIGATVAGSDAGVGTARAARLMVTGRPGTLQIRLVDALTQNNRPGMGACTGDSGAPVFEDQDRRSIVAGVVSWSTGPNNAAGCGGLTGVTPLTLYSGWILTTARGWGAGL